MEDMRYDEKMQEMMEIIGEYEERCDSKVIYDSGDNTWKIFSDRGELIFYSSLLEDVIEEIQNTMHEWDREKMHDLALQIAMEESRHNAEMEKLMNEMDNLNIEASEKYEMMELAKMSL